MEDRKSLRVKIISMGAAETGKSCLIKRFCEKRFVTKYMATLGIDFGVSKIKSSDCDIKVNIFDMAGQSFFAEVRNEFYKDTQGVMLVYDVTNRSSFDALSDWLIEIRNNLPQPSDMDSVVFIVCANKVDLGGKRKVDTSEGKLWAETKGFHYFETSAQSGEKVQDMFECLIHTVASVLTKGGKPGAASMERGYSLEQASLVTRIRACPDNYEMLGVSRG
ncbi:dnaJ homolog subfamily C member 27-like isoform X2 [Halichondria panicea]|uniref:dnaJ homolog subfamily C member 27-like isoform X2 n=1 Tax=Halichondria panicea TaxID=6063 RepID=UPI00312B8EC3